MHDIYVRCGISRAVVETIIQNLIGNVPERIPRGAEMWGVVAQIQYWMIWKSWLEEKLGFKKLEWYE